MRTPIVSVSAVVRRGHDLLVVRRGREPSLDLWSVPGGRVHHGERLRAAVEREVEEETALTVTAEHLVGVTERLGVGDDTQHFVVVCFRARCHDPRIEPVAGDDAAEAAWRPVSSLAELPMVPGLLEFLRHHGVVA